MNSKVRVASALLASTAAAQLTLDVTKQSSTRIPARPAKFNANVVIPEVDDQVRAEIQLTLLAHILAWVFSSCFLFGDPTEDSILLDSIYTKMATSPSQRLLYIPTRGGGILLFIFL